MACDTLTTLCCTKSSATWFFSLSMFLKFFWVPNYNSSLFIFTSLCHFIIEESLIFLIILSFSTFLSFQLMLQWTFLNVSFLQVTKSLWGSYSQILRTAPPKKLTLENLENSRIYQVTFHLLVVISSHVIEPLENSTVDLWEHEN